MCLYGNTQSDTQSDTQLSVSVKTYSLKKLSLDEANLIYCFTGEAVGVYRSVGRQKYNNIITHFSARDIEISRKRVFREFRYFKFSL